MGAETLLVNEYNLQEIESPDFDPQELTEIEEIIDEDSLDYQYSYDYPYGKDSEEGEDSENFHPGDEIMVRSGRRKPKGGKTKEKKIFGLTVLIIMINLSSEKNLNQVENLNL